MPGLSCSSDGAGIMLLCRYPHEKIKGTNLDTLKISIYSSGFACPSTKVATPPFLCGRRMVLLYTSPAVQSERKQQAPTCGPRSTHVLQCFARLSSRIFWSPLHPTRRYPYRSHLRLDYVCYHHPNPPPRHPDRLKSIRGRHTQGLTWRVTLPLSQWREKERR
jgi:hypothetical protein